MPTHSRCSANKSVKALGAGRFAEAPAVQGSGEKGQRRKGGALPSPHLAGKGSRVGREEGPVILFVGFCCHPVGIYLYWLLPAASSQCGTTWIREGPLPFFPPSLPQQQEGACRHITFFPSAFPRGAHLSTRNHPSQPSRLKPLSASIPRGASILAPDSTWGGTFTVPAVQTRKPLRIKCCVCSALENTGDVSGNLGAHFWKWGG